MTTARFGRKGEGDPFAPVRSWYETPHDLRRENLGKCSGLVIVRASAGTYSARCDLPHPHREIIKVQLFEDGYTTRTVEANHLDLPTASELITALTRLGRKPVVHDLEAWAESRGLGEVEGEPVNAHGRRCVEFIGRTVGSTGVARNALRVFLGQRPAEKRDPEPLMSERERERRVNTLKQQADLLGD